MISYIYLYLLVSGFADGGRYEVSPRLSIGCYAGVGWSYAVHWSLARAMGGAQFELESRRIEKCQVSFGRARELKLALHHHHHPLRGVLIN